MEIVGPDMVLSSLERLGDEPWSWLKEFRADLGPKVEAVSLHGLEVQQLVLK